MVKFAELELKRFNERLKNYNTRLFSDQTILEWAVAQLPEKDINAREIRRQLRNEVENLMSKIILESKIKDNYQLAIEKNKLAVK